MKNMLIFTVIVIALSAMASGFDNNKLVRLWHLNESSGTAIDSTGYGGDLPDIGTTPNQTGLLDGARGVFSNPNMFYSGDTNLSWDMSTSWTTGCWLYKTDTETSWAMVYTVGRINAAGDGVGCLLQYNSAQQLLYSCGINGAASTVTSSHSLGTGWHLAVGSFNATDSGLHIFIDDNRPEKGTYNKGTGYMNREQIVLGGNFDGGSYYQALAHGYLDECFIYNDSITYEDVQLLYNSGAGARLPLETAVEFSFFAESPANDTAINSPVLMYYSLNGTTGAYCELYVGGSLAYNDTTVTSGLDSIGFNSSSWSEGPNVLNLSCRYSGQTYSALKTIFVDTVVPIIDYADVVRAADGLNFEINGSTIDANFMFNISVSDANLFSFNISVCHNETPAPGECEHSAYVDDIGTTTYVYNASIDVAIFGDEGTHYFIYEACDSHTAEIIGTMPVKEIPQGVEVDGTKYYSVTAGLVSFEAVKEPDRYSFDVSYDAPLSQMTFVIESKDPLVPVSKSPYMAHFVHGRRWSDFEMKGFSVLSVDRLTEYKYSVTVRADDGPVSDLKMTSTGLINCVNRTDTAYIDALPESVNLTAPANGSAYVVDDAELLLNMSFYLDYPVSSPDNCSIFIDGVRVNTTYSPVKKTTVTLRHLLPEPLAQQNRTYRWNASCTEDHNHPPYGNDEHTVSSQTWDFYVFNSATTTTTTTAEGATTTSYYETVQDASVKGFQNQSDALTFIFLYGVWLVVIYMSYTLKGPRGKTVGILNLFQFLIGLVTGLQFIRYSFLIGIGTLFTAVLLLVGRWIYEK